MASHGRGKLHPGELPCGAAGEQANNKLVIEPNVVCTPGEVEILEDCTRAQCPLNGDWAPITEGNHLTGKSKAVIFSKDQSAIQSEYAHCCIFWGYDMYKSALTSLISKTNVVVLQIPWIMTNETEMVDSWFGNRN